MNGTDCVDVSGMIIIFKTKLTNISGEQNVHRYNVGLTISQRLPCALVLIIWVAILLIIIRPIMYGKRHKQPVQISRRDHVRKVGSHACIHARKHAHKSC